MTGAGSKKEDVMTRTLLIFILIATAATVAIADDATVSREGWLLARTQSSVPTLDRAALPQSDLGGMADLGGYQGNSKSKLLKPILLSLLMPGLGEVSMGYRRGYALMGADLATWFGVKHFNDLGEEKRDDYYIYLDEHWSEDRLEAAFGNPNDDVGSFYYEVTNYEDLSLWVSRDDDEREYYENAGKWDQFVFGWDDFVDPRNWLGVNATSADLRDNERVSSNRLLYREMRQESNDAFHHRDTMLYISMMTRIVSVFQVAYLGGVFSEDGRYAAFDVGGHSVGLIAEPRGFTATRLGFSVSY
jgi:hypothetical protein